MYVFRSRSLAFIVTAYQLFILELLQELAVYNDMLSCDQREGIPVM